VQKTGEPILMIYVSYNVFTHKDLLLCITMIASALTFLVALTFRSSCLPYGYPPWSFSKVRRQMEFKGDKRKKKNKKQETLVKRPMAVTPYVEKVLEAIVRIIKKHIVPVAMKPWKTLKDSLVHLKDKQDKEDITECVYKVPCANCDKTYAGETGTKLGVRLHEHKTEVESKNK